MWPRQLLKQGHFANRRACVRTHGAAPLYRPRLSGEAGATERLEHGAQGCWNVVPLTQFRVRSCLPRSLAPRPERCCLQRSGGGCPLSRPWPCERTPLSSPRQGQGPPCGAQGHGGAWWMCQLQCTWRLLVPGLPLVSRASWRRKPTRAAGQKQLCDAGSAKWGAALASQGSPILLEPARLCSVPPPLVASLLGCTPAVRSRCSLAACGPHTGQYPPAHSRAWLGCAFISRAPAIRRLCLPWASQEAEGIQASGRIQLDVLHVAARRSSAPVRLQPDSSQAAVLLTEHSPWARLATL